MPLSLHVEVPLMTEVFLWDCIFTLPRDWASVSVVSDKIALIPILLVGIGTLASHVENLTVVKIAIFWDMDQPK